MPVVRHGKAVDVLPLDPKVPYGRPELTDPTKTLIEKEPSFGYRTVASIAGDEQEHRAADLPAQRLAGAQAPCSPTSLHPVTAVGGHRTESTLDNGSVPRMGWQGWLAEPGAGAGAGDRLSHPATAGVAPVANGQGQHRLGRAGTGSDHSLWHAGRVTEPFLLRSDNSLVFTSRGLNHHPALPTAERDGGACDPDLEGAVCAPPSLREPSTRPAGDR